MTQRKKIEDTFNNFIFAGLTIEQMSKLPKWLLENCEKNKQKSVTKIEILITKGQMQAVMNFVAHYKTERINHTLSTKAGEWKRELDHIEEFHNEFQVTLKGNQA